MSIVFAPDNSATDPPEMDALRALVTTTLPDETMTLGELLILALRALVTTTLPDETMTLGELLMLALSRLVTTTLPDETMTLGELLILALTRFGTLICSSLAAVTATRSVPSPIWTRNGLATARPIGWPAVSANVMS